MAESAVPEMTARRWAGRLLASIAAYRMRTITYSSWSIYFTKRFNTLFFINSLLVEDSYCGLLQQGHVIQLK